MCGEVGDGCMFEFEVIYEVIVVYFVLKVFVYWCVLIMVGLMFELFDLVCGLMNCFSGKMGFVFVCVV